MASEWFVFKDGEWKGPVSSQQLKSMASTGQLQPDQKVRKGIEGKAITADRIKGLFSDAKSKVVAPVTDEWYYATNNERLGPVSASELRYLAVRGTINQTTLVWKVGMQHWQKVGDVLPQVFQSKGVFQEIEDSTLAYLPKDWRKNPWVQGGVVLLIILAFGGQMLYRHRHWFIPKPTINASGRQSNSRDTNSRIPFGEYLPKEAR